MVLSEIKDIEHECEAGAIPKEECQNQISAKKRQAADLLRKINPRLDAVVNEAHTEYSAENNDDQLPDDLPAQETDICPQCGHKIETGDKFCMHCGNRLRP
jgi:hypothetical protein